MASLVDRIEMEKLLVLTGAIEGGLIDALARRPGTVAEVAAEAAADERATRIMLEALVDLGVVEVAAGGPVAGTSWAAAPPKGAPPQSRSRAASAQGGGPPARFYRLSAIGRAHLVDPGPDFERYSLLHQARKARGWLQLPHVVAHGRPPDDGRERRKPFSFGRAMAESDPNAAEEVVDTVLIYAGLVPSRDPSAVSPASLRTSLHVVQGDPPRMIDVGGALGHMALRFAARGLAATLFDRPAMIEEARRAREALAAEIPGGGEAVSRLEYATGDFNEAFPEGPFDIVYLGNILHIYGAAVNAALVARASAALAPRGVVAIRDYVWERSPRAALFAVNMLQATEEGEVWQEADFRGWLEASGCVGVELVDLREAPNQLVLGRRE